MAETRDPGATDGPYQVVARRFRPQSFQELVGQDDVLHSLRSALQQQRIPHAFLFSGSRGVGKTTSARILARCLNCEQGPTPQPCGTCSQCRSILDGSNPDVIEIDAASNNSVEDVRQLREHANFATMRSRYRVFILDEVHMLSKGAFNALLKTLEEPPPGVVFVLATTELHKVPETIRSRCQVLLFRRVGEVDLQRRLRMIADREGVAVPDDVLAEIAAAVRGGVRDAETALERILPLAREMGAAFDLAAYRTLVARVGLDRTLQVVQALLGGDARAGLAFAQELQQRGADEREALGEIVEALRWCLLLKVDGADSGLVPVGGVLREQLQGLAAAASQQQLDAMIAAGLLGRERLRRLEDRGVVFEVALVRMAQAGTLPTLADLLAEVRAGGLAPAAAPAGAGAAPRPTFGSGGAPRPAPAAGAASANRPGPAGAAPPAALPPVGAPVRAGDLKARSIAELKPLPLLQTTLELCRFDGPDPSGKLVVVLANGPKMHRDRLATAGVQRDLAAAIQRAHGAPLQIEFRAVEPGASEAAAGGAPAAAPREPSPAAKKVLEAFRGRIVQVDPEDRIRPARPGPAADEPAGDEAAPGAGGDGGPLPDLQE